MMRNYNDASPVSWIAFIFGLDGVTFKLKDFTLPAIVSDPIRLGNQSPIICNVPGDHIQYDDLIINFVVDMNYDNYLSIFNWIYSNVNNYDKTGYPYERDINISILDGSGNIIGTNFTFKDCFPIRLGEIILESSTDITTIICSASFAFNDLELFCCKSCDNEDSQQNVDNLIINTNINHPPIANAGSNQLINLSPDISYNLVGISSNISINSLNIDGDSNLILLSSNLNSMNGVVTINLLDNQQPIADAGLDQTVNV